MFLNFGASLACEKARVFRALWQVPFTCGWGASPSQVGPWRSRMHQRKATEVWWTWELLRGWISEMLFEDAPRAVLRFIRSRFQGFRWTLSAYIAACQNCNYSNSHKFSKVVWIVGASRCYERTLHLLGRCHLREERKFHPVRWDFDDHRRIHRVRWRRVHIAWAVLALSAVLSSCPICERIQVVLLLIVVIEFFKSWIRIVRCYERALHLGRRCHLHREGKLHPVRWQLDDHWCIGKVRWRRGENPLKCFRGARNVCNLE